MTKREVVNTPADHSSLAIVTRSFSESCSPDGEFFRCSLRFLRTVANTDGALAADPICSSNQPLAALQRKLGLEIWLLADGYLGNA